MNDEQSLYKPMRIIPYHISIFLAERDKDEYEAFIEADSGAGTTAVCKRVEPKIQWERETQRFKTTNRQGFISSPTWFWVPTLSLAPYPSSVKSGCRRLAGK
jgi:hypothetical protein